MEKELATHSSILAWKIPCTDEPSRLQSMGVSRVGHNLVTKPLNHHHNLCIRWPKYWSFSISPSSEYSGLIPFRIDWFDLLAVQRTLRSLLQHHSSKASILWCSAFFTVQLSQLCVTTGKTIALTRRTFVGKAMSLLFNTLSMLGCSAVSDCLRPHGL